MSYPKFKDLDVVWDLPVGCGEWDHIVTVLQQLEGHLVPLHFSDLKISAKTHPTICWNEQI